MAETVDEPWFVQFPDKVSGPFTLEQMQKLALTGRLSPQYMVTQNELVWHEASKVANLEFSPTDSMEKIPKGQLLLKCKCGKEYAVPSSYSGMMRPCPKCGEKNRVPINSVASDETQIEGAPRPLLLAIWTVAVMALTTGSAAGLAWWFFAIESKLTANVVLAMAAAAVHIFFLFELRGGRYWAWVGIQIVWAVFACWLFVMRGDWLISLARSGLFLIVMLPMWLHIYTQGVVNYCFARRVE